MAGICQVCVGQRQSESIVKKDIVEESNLVRREEVLVAGEVRSCACAARIEGHQPSAAVSSCVTGRVRPTGASRSRIGRASPGFAFGFPSSTIVLLRPGTLALGQRPSVADIAAHRYPHHRTGFPSTVIRHAIDDGLFGTSRTR